MSRCESKILVRAGSRNPAVFERKPGDRCQMSTRSCPETEFAEIRVSDLSTVNSDRYGVHMNRNLCFLGIAMVIDVPNGAEIKARANWDRHTRISSGKRFYTGVFVHSATVQVVKS